MQFSIHAVAPPVAARRAMSPPRLPTPAGASITLAPDNAAADPHAWRHYFAQIAAAAVDAYIRAWNETDPAARAALLDACWESDASFKDGMGVTDGREALNAYIAAARLFVPGLHRSSPMARGSNFGQLSLAGRLLSATGFQDKA